MSRTLTETVVHQGVVYAAGTTESDITDASKIGADVWDSKAVSEAPAGYSTRTVDELQAEVESRGLEVEGSGKDGKVVKADLIAALEADEQSA